MKRIVILILLAACFNAAKAQHLIPVKPEFKLTDSLQGFKPNTYLSPKALLLQPVQQGNPALFNDKNTRIVYSRMPVVGTASNDRMPVAGMGQTGNQDNMPVLKVTVVDPLAKQEQQIP